MAVKGDMTGAMTYFGHRTITNEVCNSMGT